MVEFNLMSAPQSKLSVDLVIPVFNEAGVIEQTYAKVREVIDPLPYLFTVYFVDDGSSDTTHESLSTLADTDTRIHTLTFSRNFGHQAALTAGLDASCGDFVITLDGDGQHPPEMIPEMIKLFEQGYDIIQGAAHRNGIRAPSLKQVTSSGFYSLMIGSAARR